MVVAFDSSNFAVDGILYLYSVHDLCYDSADIPDRSTPFSKGFLCRN